MPWYWQQMYMEGMADEIGADREAVGGGSAPTDVAPGVRQHTERVDFTTMPTAAVQQWLRDQGPQ